MSARYEKTSIYFQKTHLAVESVTAGHDESKLCSDYGHRFSFPKPMQVTI
eukprot:CAMPEP_0178803534 /NCGR_PEP_ID=MMETSP0745-20121128/14530_1 /TAXON_ID=913974 /ORGANISM="Nitzschia punctata, Strain CCMP561" /LENGTH=49 /DNA_ID=CAMNT_0020462639 /DNA_START=61 /DNA_END=210 /DNA_ORIENTATION=-